MNKTIIIFLILSITIITFANGYMISEIEKEFDSIIGPHTSIEIDGNFTINGKVTLESNEYFEVTNRKTGEVFWPEIVIPEVGSSDTFFKIQNIDLDGQYLVHTHQGPVKTYSEETMSIAAQRTGTTRAILFTVQLFVAAISYFAVGYTLKKMLSVPKKNN